MIAKTTYYFNQPILKEKYYYDDNNRLDSVLAYSVTKKESNVYSAEFVGKLVYDDNNVVDMKVSNYYLIDQRYPISFNNSQDFFVFNLYTNDRIKILTVAKLDSAFNEFDIMNQISIDENKYSFKLNPIASGFGYYSGTIRFCLQDKFDTTMYRCDKFLFYIPFFTLNKTDLKKFPCN